jgi:hypothetical protein
MSEPPTSLTYQSWVVLGLFGLVIVSLALSLVVHVFGYSQVSPAVVASLVFGIVALPIILVLVVPDFRGDLKTVAFGPAGVNIQIERVERVERQAQAAEHTAQNAFDNVVKFIFRGMPAGHYYNLRKIAKKEVGREGRSFGEFRMDEGFRGQLRYLRDSGYINVKGSVGDLPQRGNELNEHVSVTSLGEEFIRLREQYV